QLVQQGGQLEPALLLNAAARRPAGAGLYRRLQPPPFTLERAALGGRHVTRLHETGDAAQRRQFGGEFAVGTPVAAPGGQDGGPPALAPGQQAAYVATAQR